MPAAGRSACRRRHEPYSRSSRHRCGWKWTNGDPMMRPGRKSASAARHRARRISARSHRPEGRYRQWRPFAHVRVGFAQRGDHLVDAGGQHVTVGTQLDREPVGGLHRGGRAQHVPQPGMVTDQGNRTRPGGNRAEALYQGQPDHRPDRVAGAAGPAGGLQFSDQPGNLGQAQQCGDVCSVVNKCYGRSGHGVGLPGPDPRSVTSTRGGHPLFLTLRPYREGLTKLCI
jgi:hypothetical protein